MKRLVLGVLLVPLAAMAERADFSSGAVVVGMQFGTGAWALDRTQMASQIDPVRPGDANVFIADAVGGPSASLRLGYNILGHATVEAVLTATGWELFTYSIGGGGFLAGAVHWHPLELVWREAERPLPIDGSIFFGYGWGIAGSRRGMDGNVAELGLDAHYYLGKTVGAGLFARTVLLNFGNYYVDYYDQQAPGNTIPLPKGSGGSFWTLGVSLDFRFETS